MGSKEKESGTGIRPWRCAKASFKIQTPPKGQRKERKLMRKGARAMVEELSKAPFIDVGLGGAETRALVDTGADWSLLDSTYLTQEELTGLSSCRATGQGVSKEPICILGEVWRDVLLGDVVVPQQRFVVVKEMVTRAILGADFWVRIGAMTLNFKERKLVVSHLSLELKLHETDEIDQSTGDDEKTRVDVRLMQETEIPSHTEKLVVVDMPGCVEGQKVLIEPFKDDECPFNVPFTVCRVAGGQTAVRVANIGAATVKLEKQSVIATADTKVQVVNRVRSRGSMSQELLSKIKIGDNLTSKQESEIRALIMSHKDVFYDGGELPVVNVGIEHSIRLKEDTGPVAHQPRRLSREAEREVRQELRELEKMGVIRPSNSPWAAPIVCARRQDGSIRLAIDYRALNIASLPATLHPIPRMDDLVDRLTGAKYFAILDAKCGYHQMPLKTEETELTAFVVPWAQYEFTDRTPFGLKGAGYSFQRFMSRILGESNFVDAICYLDDVLVWGPTWEIFMARLRRVLVKISMSGLALSPKKCAFGVDEVLYLGAVIKNGMVGIGEQRTQQLKELPSPGSLEEVRRVLGAFAFVQKWLPGLADVARPLYDLVGNNGKKKFVWSKKCEEAFQKLKSLVAEAVTLRIPREDAEFTVVTDASDTGTGAMLAQREGETLVPVAFSHHALSPAERKYDTTEKELLAVVLACKKWRIYLDQPFDLITDHNALRWLNTLATEDHRGRRGRWVDFLQQFQIRPIHKKGKSSVMSMADYLSRVNADGSVRVIAPLKMTEYHLPVSITGLIDVEELLGWQDDDAEVQSWKEAVRTGNWSEVEKVPSVKDRLFLDGKGILRVKFCRGRRTKDSPFGKTEINRVVVPRSQRKKACRMCHDAPLAGHMGIRRTWQRVRDSFWWEEMKQDVTNHVKDCEECGVNKHSTRPSQAPVQKTDIPARVLEKLQVDFVGPFGISTAHEYRYALQIQDVLSRFVIFVPTARNDAKTAATAVFDEWVCKFGFPLKLQSDQGRHFAAEVFENMCKLGGIKHEMGSVGHAQSQGQVERQNQLLNQTRALCSNQLDGWPTAIYRVQHAHNIAVNETTGISPHEMMFGQSARSPEATVLMEEEEAGEVIGRVGAVECDKGALDKNRAAKQRLKNLLTEIGRSNISEFQKKREERQESRARPYEVGDLARVRLNDMQKRALGGKKIAPRNSEPYLIIRKLGEWTYIMVKLKDKDKTDAKKIRRHYNELVPCHVQDTDIADCYWIKLSVEQEGTPATDSPARRTESPTPEVDPIQDVDRTEVAGPRRSGRSRKEVQRLQLDWRKKRYETEEMTGGATDEDEDREPEVSSESEYEDAGDSSFRQ